MSLLEYQISKQAPDGSVTNIKIESTNIPGLFWFQAENKGSLLRFFMPLEKLPPEVKTFFADQIYERKLGDDYSISMLANSNTLINFEHQIEHLFFKKLAKRFFFLMVAVFIFSSLITGLIVHKLYC